jgi:hypothetical protein
VSGQTEARGGSADVAAYGLERACHLPTLVDLAAGAFALRSTLQRPSRARFGGRADFARQVRKLDAREPGCC